MPTEYTQLSTAAAPLMRFFPRQLGPAPAGVLFVVQNMIPGDSDRIYVFAGAERKTPLFRQDSSDYAVRHLGTMSISVTCPNNFFGLDVRLEITQPALETPSIIRVSPPGYENNQASKLAGAGRNRGKESGLGNEGSFWLGRGQRGGREVLKEWEWVRES